MDVWRETDIPLFVHFHGYDVTSICETRIKPEMQFHPEDYLSNIRELESGRFYRRVSVHEIQLVEAGVSSQNVIVKYYGVPVPGRQGTYIRRRSTPNPSPRKFVDFKFLDRTIQAFEIARSKGLDARLIMVGDGPLKPGL